MKRLGLHALLSALAMSALPGMARASDQVYIEFLWERPLRGALARAEAHGFTLEPSRDHRVCVAALGDWRPGDRLAIEVIDAGGRRASRQVHEDFRGAIRITYLAKRSPCHPHAAKASATASRVCRTPGAK